MKPSVKIVICMVFLIALLAVSCVSAKVTVNKSAGPENKLIGVWKLAELVDTDLDIPETEKEVVADYHMVFTKKYRFVVGSRIPSRQELPESPTDSQLVAAWEPVVAFAFTYEVKGNAVIEHLLFSKNPNEKQGEQGSHPFKFDESDLIWTIMSGGNTFTLRFMRLE